MVSCSLPRFRLCFVVSRVAQPPVGLPLSTLSTAGILEGALTAVLGQCPHGDTGDSRICRSPYLWPAPRAGGGPHPSWFQLLFSRCLRTALGCFWYVFTSSDVLLLSLLLYIRPWCCEDFVTVKWFLSKWLDFEDHGDTLLLSIVRFCCLVVLFVFLWRSKNYTVAVTYPDPLVFWFLSLVFFSLFLVSLCLWLKTVSELLVFFLLLAPPSLDFQGRKWYINA